ncbi:MAG: PIN domain protein [Bacteroidota bacterium]
MRPQRIYIDTSVIGGCFDEAFAVESNWLIDQIQQGRIKAIYSEVTEQELRQAPQHIKDLMKSLPRDNFEYISITDEATELALSYISEQVVGKTSLADCLHMAIATIQRADILASWNFKHIVNVTRIRGYNSVNIKLGYPIIDIRSPKEIVEYED